MSAERIAELKRTLIGLPTTEWDAHIAQALSASTPMPGAACEHPPEACRHIEENGAYSYVRHGTWCSACGALNTGTWKSPSPPASPRVERCEGWVCVRCVGGAHGKCSEKDCPCDCASVLGAMRAGPGSSDPNYHRERARTAVLDIIDRAREALDMLHEAAPFTSQAPEKKAGPGSGAERAFRDGWNAVFASMRGDEGCSNTVEDAWQRRSSGFTRPAGGSDGK